MTATSLKLRGSLSRYDVECTPLGDWDAMWLELRCEYWNALFRSCGNVHPFRSAFARKSSMANRQKECHDRLRAMNNPGGEVTRPTQNPRTT